MYPEARDLYQRSVTNHTSIAVRETRSYLSFAQKSQIDQVCMYSTLVFLIGSEIVRPSLDLIQHRGDYQYYTNVTNLLGIFEGIESESGLKFLIPINSHAFMTLMEMDGTIGALILTEGQKPNTSHAVGIRQEYGRSIEDIIFRKPYKLKYKVFDTRHNPNIYQIDISELPPIYAGSELYETEEVGEAPDRAVFVIRTQ